MMIETTVDGRYQILARVAAGGMGEVYRAHDPVLDREVALKILHPQLADDPGFIDRFRREARSAGVLSHPNIVAVHDWGETGGTYFMVMEYVRGPNLRAILVRDGTLEPRQAVEVVDGVLGALEHAHRQGIVHRDIKPENVMITTADGVVKVADFGLARAFADARVSQAPGTVTGTVQYLAPEQIEGENADPRTDLYATGVVLYELLTGRVPFTGETSVAIAYKHLRERVPPPSRSNPMVTAELDRAVLRSTDRDRDRRTPDARTMRREIAGADADLPPAPPLAELASSVAPSDEVPADRLATVTIPRTLSPRARRRQRLARWFRYFSLLVVLAVAGWAVWTFLIPHNTTVPPLGGDPLATAEREAQEANLDLVFSEEFSSTVPAGRIVSQRPPPGTEVEEGTEVSVVVSRGPELAPVPQVTGLHVDEATRRIEGAGFKVGGIEEVYHDQVPKNEVIGQNPDPETNLEVGKPVRLTVSLGKEPVQVPEVVGLGEGEAGAILLGARLEVEVTEAFSGEVARGLVISQEPPAGETVPQDSTVRLVVSRGPRSFAMPDVVGQTATSAQAQLEGAGLVVQRVQIPGTTGSQVVYTQPKAGDTVQSGQLVKIYTAD